MSTTSLSKNKLDAPSVQKVVKSANQENDAALAQMEDGSGKMNATDAFKPASWERPIFSLVCGMVKGNNIPYGLFLSMMVLEDFQLFSFSWRKDIVETEVLRYIFNPGLLLADKLTMVSHIVSLVLLTLLLLSMVYCGISLASGQMRSMYPLHLLRTLVTFCTTIFFIPILETFIAPTTCENDVPVGYKDLKCHDGGHSAILATAGVGAFLVIPIAALMSLLYFDSSYASKTGKRTGRTDVFYVLIRIGLVVAAKFAESTVAAGVNCGLLFLLWAFFASQQPFFNNKLNNLRSGIFFASFCLAVCIVVYSAVGSKSQIAIVIAGLVISAVAAVGVFFANAKIVSLVCKKIYGNLQKYDLVLAQTLKQNSPSGVDNIRKSYMELLYQNTDDIVRRRAVVEKIQVFPAAVFSEVAVRFIQSSYMDKDAVTLATRLLEVATLQFPNIASVYLQYLGYITSYLHFLRGKERVHLSVMLRKCYLSIDERFLVYLFQQSVRQTDEMGRELDGESDLQYTSYIEYQSLENSVKKYHVDTLSELRDFWQAVRNDSAVNALTTRLNKIAVSAKKTNELYQKLAARFPNSRNMLLLYSRFLSKVASDFEQANMYVDMADNVEQDNVTVDDDVNKPDDIERKSAAQSRSSTGSKETRLLRQKRMLLTSRMNLGMKAFIRKMNIASLIFIILLVVSVVVAKQVVDATNQSLDELVLAMIPRKFTHKIYADVRRIQLASEKRNKTDFNYYFKDVAYMAKDWREKITPFFSTYTDHPNRKFISLWDSSAYAYTVETRNAYEAAFDVKTCLDHVIRNQDYEAILKDDPSVPVEDYMTLYANAEESLHDHCFRYILDNLDAIYELFDTICTDVVYNYAGSVYTENTIITVLFGVLIFILVLAGLVLPHINLRACFQTQTQILSLLKKIPRNLVLAFITDLEEEIEVICGDNDRAQGQKTVATNNNEERANRMTLKWQYLLLIFGMLGAVPGMLAAVLIHTTTTQYVPVAFNYSTQRRTDKSKRIYAMGVEAWRNDNTTWRPFMAEATMLESVLEMERLHEKVSAMLEPFMKDTNSDLFKTLRTGGNCPYPTDQECDARLNPAIGYTDVLIRAGSDTQVLRFMSEAKLYMETYKTRAEGGSIYDKHLLLMENMADDFAVSSDVVKKNILSIVDQSIANTSVILFALFGAVIGLSFCAYYIGFYRTATQYALSNNQLIALLYSITPEDRAKLSDLNTFVESGGAIMP